MIKTKPSKQYKKHKCNDKPWFNSECKRERSQFFTTKRNINGKDQNSKNERKKLPKNTKKL